jgi:hypothetical protein
MKQFAPMKLGGNKILLPSGVVASKDGKYHYWQCSVSGLETFAKPEYWVKVMAKFGTEENLVKTYVCRKAKILMDQGHSQDEIVNVLTISESPSARKGRKEVRKITAERKEVAKRPRKGKLKAIKKEVVKEIVNGVETEVVKKTYPWSNDPNYFAKSGPGTVDYSADTTTCHFPPRFLDQFCHGCPIYDKCAYEGKHAPGAHLDPKKTAKQVPLVKKIAAFTREEIEAEKAAE